MHHVTRPLALAAILALPGCSPGALDLLRVFGEAGGTAANRLEAIGERGYQGAAAVLRSYCSNAQWERDRLRRHLNDRQDMEGIELAVWCPGDRAMTLPSRPQEKPASDFLPPTED